MWKERPYWRMVLECWVALWWCRPSSTERNEVSLQNRAAKGRKFEANGAASVRRPGRSSKQRGFQKHLTNRLFKSNVSFRWYFLGIIFDVLTLYAVSLCTYSPAWTLTLWFLCGVESACFFLTEIALHKADLYSYNYFISILYYNLVISFVFDSAIQLSRANLCWILDEGST